MGNSQHGKEEWLHTCVEAPVGVLGMGPPGSGSPWSLSGIRALHSDCRLGPSGFPGGSGRRYTETAAMLAEQLALVFLISFPCRCELQETFISKAPLPSAQLVGWICGRLGQWEEPR